ncbi:MAG: hypothetical protein JWO06_2806, partial [Bacteroidota bacterium]|nr:hypothetical protein [Bacteroidota bacterium]
MFRSNFTPKFLIVLVFSFFLLQHSSGAARFWVGGANATWALAANWSATSGGTGGAGIPVAADDVTFDAASGSTINVTSIPTQTIHSLTVTGNTTVTLQSTVANVTLSLNIGSALNALVVSSGSTLILGSTTATFTLNFITTATQKGDISGTLQVNTSNAFTTTVITTAAGVTVSSTGTIKNNGGAVTGSAASLTVASGGTYNHASTAGTVPTATWSAGSNLTITTAANSTVAGLGQTFSNFNINAGSGVV